MKYPKKKDIFEPDIKIKVTPNFRGLNNVHYCEFIGKFADNKMKLAEEFRYWNQECEKILKSSDQNIKQHFIVDTSNSTSSVRDGYNMGKASEQIMEEIPLVKYPNLGSYIMLTAKPTGAGAYVINKVLTAIKSVNYIRKKYVHEDENIYIVDNMKEVDEILKNLKDIKMDKIAAS